MEYEAPPTGDGVPDGGPGGGGGGGGTVPDAGPGAGAGLIIGPGGEGAGRTLAKMMMITRRIIAPTKNPPRPAFHELVGAGAGGAATAIYYNKTKISATHEDRALRGQISATHLL